MGAELGFKGLSATLRNLNASTNASGAPWSSATKTPNLRLTVVSSSTGASHALFKAVLEVPFPVRACVQVVVGDSKARLKWDRNIGGIDSAPMDPRIAWACANADDARDFPAPRGIIQYSLTKAVGPISARDFVDAVLEAPVSSFPPDAAAAAAAAGVARGSYISAAHGVPIGSAIDRNWPNASGIVRGVNDACAWVFEPLAAADANVREFGPLVAPNGATRITYLIQSDIRGWVPTMVVNSSIYGLYKEFAIDLLARLEELANA
jgi:hypothetical protein